MLFDIPIEALPDRYSADWNQWFQTYYETNKIKWTRIYPLPLSNKIKHGAFLDAIVTNHFKSKQLTMICDLFHQNKVKDGDAFLFHDMWFPGIEMLAYIRSMLNINFKIYGLLHAGTYDVYDRLTQKGMKDWGQFSEKAWTTLVDGIFVATMFHEKLLKETRQVQADKIHVTGFPIYDLRVPKVPKENIVVFPHRLDIEKQPHLFDLLQFRIGHQYPGWSFLKTKDVCTTKEEYYNLLAKSKIAVSFALQETWGIAMQEAVILGCIPIVPSRLSYLEMYCACFKYTSKGSDESFQAAANKIEEAILHYDQIKNLAEHLRNQFLYKGTRAINTMVTIMQQQGCIL